MRMGDKNLAQLLDTVETPVDLLRRGKPKAFPEVESEYTHWIEEQRAWMESCSLADQSHHMIDLIIQGPDVLDLVSDLGVNNFQNFDVGQAKQFVTCNPDGYLVGDGILFYLDENKLNLVGIGPVNNWVEYHIETGDYDVSFERNDNSAVRDGDPKFFRYQIQGPNAYDVMEEVTEESIPDIPFFNFDQLTIDGHEVKALRHGMSGEPGLEFWGPWEEGDEVKEIVMEAGQEYGIQHLGTKSYQSATTMLGWVAVPVPAIFGDNMADYRQWLGEDRFEANFAIGGSFDSDDISDYYVTPAEVGYKRFIDFDHDFIGRDALKERVENQKRERVTLVWNDEDVIDAYASLFQEGETNKFMHLPAPRWAAAQYDAVQKDEETVGVSKIISYSYNHREMLSVAIVDTEYAEPGTEVTLLWGDEESPHPNVERHSQTEIRATVAPSPYSKDRR